MTEADLIRDCRAYEAEHGILKLLSILEDIIECQAQAAGVELLDIGITGTVDAEVIHPDASVMVRIRDRWFEASELVAAG